MMTEMTYRRRCVAAASDAVRMATTGLTRSRTPSWNSHIYGNDGDSITIGMGTTSAVLQPQASSRN